jgi:hypothetical protein
MKMPFQFSLHIQQYPKEDKPEHVEFLADGVEDPRRSLAEKLCEYIPRLGVNQNPGCAMAYNMSFEKGVLRQLAADFPDLAPHLMSIHDAMIDLMIPFQKRYWYRKELKGSYSIKAVLPAFFPEMDYHNLEGVHNAGEAPETYLALRHMNADERETARKNLRLYCERDTFAMILLLDVIRMLSNSYK